MRPSGSTTRTVAGGSLRTPVRMVRGGGTTLWKRQVVVQRDRVDRGVDVAAGEQRGQGAGEAQPVRGLGEVERLDAEPVAGQHDRPVSRSTIAIANMPMRWSTKSLAPLQVGLEDDLGVAAGEEPVAVALELGPQLLVVVDAAVEDAGQPDGGVDHGLAAGRGQVDDLQPPVPERDPALGPGACPVRSAVGHRRGHPLDREDVRSAAVASYFAS